MGFVGLNSTMLSLAFFLFLYFQNRLLQKYIFGFIIYSTPTTRLRGGRPPAALLPGDRDLNVNKIYFYSHFDPWGRAAGRPVPAARWRGGRPTRRPAGGRQPPLYIKG